MALDEYIFNKFVRFLKHRGPDPELKVREVRLETIQPRLTVLARALTGKAIDIFPAVKEGGYKANNFFLPAVFSFYEQSEANLSWYIFRVCYLSVQQKLRLNWVQETALSDEAAIDNARETAPKVLSALFSEYPLIRRVYDRLVIQPGIENNAPIDTRWLYGKWMTDTDAGETIETGISLNKIKQSKATQPKTIINARPVEEIVNLIIDAKQQEDYVLTHNFEKVETADEFSGTWRDFDGEDELEKHEDALDELNMKYTVRTDDETHSVYQAEFTDNALVAESKEMNSEGYYIAYDEWDCFKRIYRKGHSKIFPSQHSTTDVQYYATTLAQNRATLARLRKMLTSVNNKWQQQRLQTHGKDTDFEMVVDRFADIYSGCTPSENIYISDRKKEKDLSILLLLDISLSSDSYAAGNRVIDIEKQAAILFGEILNEFNVDFAIQAFYSKTRNYSSYISLKSFNDKWNTAKYAIGALQPSGYTRIGPALRHSGALLQKRETKNKWIILLSDGKPNDYDRYEGKYGINDVKQALRELHHEQINTYALAIEATARYYLPQMFGQNHYHIVSNPDELLQSLGKLFERIRIA